MPNALGRKRHERAPRKYERQNSIRQGLRKHSARRRRLAVWKTQNSSMRRQSGLLKRPTSILRRRVRLDRTTKPKLETHSNYNEPKPNRHERNSSRVVA